MLVFEYKSSDGKKIDVVWDKECHRLAVDIDSIIEDEKLPSTEGPLIKEALKEAFNNKRELIKSQYEAQKKSIRKHGTKTL